mmetsp:Transcript_174710/g.560329  ORF Transcript_174710/g.560329 Transcript_174710/m.560329 type:complete len:258 (-) Transcript_174710:185-958(-)
MGGCFGCWASQGANRRRDRMSGHQEGALGGFAFQSDPCIGARGTVALTSSRPDKECSTGCQQSGPQHGDSQAEADHIAGHDAAAEEVAMVVEAGDAPLTDAAVVALAQRMGDRVPGWRPPHQASHTIRAASPRALRARDVAGEEGRLVQRSALQCPLHLVGYRVASLDGARDFAGAAEDDVGGAYDGDACPKFDQRRQVGADLRQRQRLAGAEAAGAGDEGRAEHADDGQRRHGLRPVQRPPRGQRRQVLQLDLLPG